MKEVSNKVIVWSIDDFNTLGLMRQFGQSDLDFFFLIYGKAGFASKSKYCKRFSETKTIEDGLRYLKEYFSNESFKPILIVASDDIVTFLDERQDVLSDNFILPLTSQKGNVKKYTDKNNMTALARDLGILCPESRFFKWDSAINGIEYPCIIKPSHQKPGHYNEFKYKICKNEKQLKRVQRYVRHDSEFILQKCIPKEADILVYGGRMRDQKTVIAGAMVRDRFADSGSASHGYLIGDVPSCVDVDKINQFLDIIDYYGTFSFEYGLVDNKAFFFEVNLRNDGTSHYFYQAGANIPLAYVYSCAGLNYTQIPTKVKRKVWFIDEIFDVENVVSCRISAKKMKEDMKEASVFKYYDKDDLEPFKIVKQKRIKQMIQDLILKRFRLYIVFVLDKIGLRK